MTDQAHNEPPQGGPWVWLNRNAVDTPEFGVGDRVIFDALGWKRLGTVTRYDEDGVTIREESPDALSVAAPEPKSATTPKEKTMTDQNIPAGLTPEDAKKAREWALHALNKPGASTTAEKAVARVVLAALPAPTRPTLADMTDEERADCKWMQADVANRRVRYVIANPSDEEGDAVLIGPDGEIKWIFPERVTPRPDLPRMEWPGDTPTGSNTLAVGAVIESADDTRLSELPVGSMLIDRDGGVFDVTKNYTGEWDGPGYVPTQGTGTKWGPWTVRRIGKGADQ